MKEYKFLDKALISVEDIKCEFKSKANLYKTLNKLVAEEKIVRLKKDLYATTDDVYKSVNVQQFEIATALYKGAYVAYHSALEYHGLATQIFFTVHLITPKRYNPQIIENMEYICFQSEYNEGVEEHYSYAPIRVTNLERTLIDCINHLDIAGGIEEVFWALTSVKYCDEKKLLKYLKGFNKKILYKKTGYLFSQLKPDYLSDNFYKVCKENMSQRKDDIRENIMVDYVYNAEWKLYAPEELINTKY